MQCSASNNAAQVPDSEVDDPYSCVIAYDSTIGANESPDSGYHCKDFKPQSIWIYHMPHRVTMRQYKEETRPVIGLCFRQNDMACYQSTRQILCFAEEHTIYTFREC